MAKVNVLKEILDWSTDRPNWQRDALRRLVVQGELQKSDIEELAALCKERHGLADKVESEPLAKQHLREPEAAATPVALTSLTHHSGVNALAQDQMIAFGAPLTVVYGANAAGKSGYTRILKRACRARGAEDILGNVLEAAAPPRPSATISCIVGEDGRDVEWRAGVTRVFDRFAVSLEFIEDVGEDRDQTFLFSVSPIELFRQAKFRR